jgi:hypothetical protein
MDCKLVRRRLAAYIDGELDKQARETVKTHLNLCSACSVEYDHLKKTLQAARAWRPRPLPEGFAAAVQERAARGEKPRPANVRPLGVWAVLDRTPRWAWQAAAACLILVVGLALGHLVWPRHVQVAGPVKVNGAREGALTTLATLQKLKLVLGMREGTERTIVELSAMQRQLAEAIGPDVAAQVAAYHRAESLIAWGEYDEANAILDRLEAADPPFVLAPYVRITRLAAQPLPVIRPTGRGIYVQLLMPEVLASPERLYEEIAVQTRRLARLYAQAIERGLAPFEKLSFPEAPEQPRNAPE